MTARQRRTMAILLVFAFTLTTVNMSMFTSSASADPTGRICTSKIGIKRIWSSTKRRYVSTSYRYRSCSGSTSYA